ncbi:MAG: hypothetical protein IPJ19_09880 [Planctomycetes bacterium]|nr:hypothetical protein [Planctomycetota bacterium]
MFTTLLTNTRAAGLLLAACALLPQSSSAQTYKVDDGTPGASLTYGLPEDFCWLDVLHVNGTATITSIEAMFGDAPTGTPVTLCIWRDLSGAGDPTTGLLLTQVTTTVQNGGQFVFTQYPVTPTMVSGSFFVGAYMTVDGSFSPATLDPHTAWAGHAWFCTAYGPGTFDPTFLGNWTLYAPPTIGHPGVFMLRANGINGPDPDLRCVAKTNSLGCLPVTSFSGVASASAGSGFQLLASNVRNQKTGMLLYTLNGLQPTAFGGGTLCLRAPLHRTSALGSGGTVGGSDCSGVYSFDFNAYIASGANPAILPGVTVDAQFWSRDPGFALPNNVGLSQAVHFGIAP